MTALVHANDHFPASVTSTAPDYPPVQRTLLAGVALAVLGFGGFSTWASLAPLASAAVAPGIIVADTNRKTIQHLDGGIIAEILVRDGDQVEAGQTLMRLDDLETRSTVTLLEDQRRGDLGPQRLEACIVERRPADIGADCHALHVEFADGAVDFGERGADVGQRQAGEADEPVGMGAGCW